MDRFEDPRPAGDLGRDASSGDASSGDEPSGDEPPPGWRTGPPEALTPIDPDAPASGHIPPPERPPTPAAAPEQDWGVAAPRIFPLLRAVGTSGLVVETLDPRALAQEGMKARAESLVDEGPGGLPVVYAISAERFDVIVNADHVLTWGVTTADIQDAALANLRAWSAATPWADERSADRRLLSSQSGEGWDASRIILPEVRSYLAAELGGAGRVLVGLPERHLLVAGAYKVEDEEFPPLLAEFVVEQSGQADEPIDRRLFELVDGDLVPFVD